MPDIYYEIIQEIDVLSGSSRGWTKGRPAGRPYDQREWVRGEGWPANLDRVKVWSPDGEKMGKGVTLTAAEELAVLRDLAAATQPGFRGRPFLSAACAAH